MKIQAAVTNHRFRTFVAVAVRRGTTMIRTRADELALAISMKFGGLPVVLVEASTTGRARYYGDWSIVTSLRGVHPAQLPWRDYWL